MFILIRKDDWDGIAIVLNHLGKPKLFDTATQAFNYAEEFQLCPYQVVQVTI